MKRYVQRKGGQGEKWEVSGEGGHTIDQELFFVAFRDGVCFHLPKSDYVLCEPPEEWEDVTGRVIESSTPGNWMLDGRDILGLDEGVRLKRIDLMYEGCDYAYAFLIERVKS